MKLKTRYSLAGTAAGLVILSLTGPAVAAAGDTTATVTVTGGALEISVPTTAGSLGSRANTVNGGTISGLLGQVQVTDARSAAAGAGWVASVISSAFTPPAGATIAASQISYTAGTIAKTGTATFTANDPPNLTGASPAVTATWNPTIHVNVAGGTVAGTYSATITHSVI